MQYKILSNGNQINIYKKIYPGSPVLDYLWLHNNK